MYSPHHTRLRHGKSRTFLTRRTVGAPMGTVRVGSVLIDVKDFAKMTAFWRGGPRNRQVRPPEPDGPFVILKDPEGKGPNVSIDGMEPYRNRIPLAPYTDDPEGEV